MLEIKFNDKNTLFKGMPDSFILTSFIFAYLLFYLLYTSLRGSQLNYFEFYVISFLPILLLVTIRGRELFDILGFNLNHAPLYIAITRLLIVCFIGFLVGYGIYKMSSLTFSLFGFHIFPFDVFWLQLTTPTSPAFLTLMDVIVIAGFEETIRAVGMMGYANAFYKRGFKESTSIFLGMILSAVLFIVIHYFSWHGLNLPSLIIGSATVIAMTWIGFSLYYKEIWGKVAFVEFSIWGPIVAHATYDFLVFQNLSFGLGIIPGLFKILRIM
jgi:hypothetical protein